MTGLESVAAMADLAASLKNLLSSNEQKSDHSLGDHLAKVLRTLYFTPVGVLKFLREIEVGEKVSAERIEAALISFNDREPQVAVALTELDYDKLAKDLRLNITTTAALATLRYGKGDLRHEIQNEINYYGQDGVKPDRKRVQALIKGIEALNRSIEELEVVINKRAKGS